jgi:Type VI secretion system (T6SS), amidase effector protein 4
MPQIPSVATLVKNYPTGSADAAAKLVGGTVEANYSNPKYKAYKNTCAIRVSRALNYAGDPIPAAGGGISNPFMKDKKIRTDKGGDGKRYIYSTYDIRAYLTGRYGQPKRFPGTATKADLAGVKGIIAFGFFHIDVWDGSKCAGHDEGFGNAAVVSREILVWQAP